MADYEIIAAPIDEPIVVVAEGQDPIVVVAAEIDDPTVVTIAEADEALQAHSLLMGKGGHIPLAGIGDSEVNSIGIEKIRDLLDRLVAIEEAIESPAPVEQNPFIFTLSDFFNPTYYFYGGKDSNNVWRVHRWSRNGLVNMVASVVNNSAYVSLEAAWEVRSVLTYGEG